MGLICSRLQVNYLLNAKQKYKIICGSTMCSRLQAIHLLNNVRNSILNAAHNGREDGAEGKGRKKKH